MRNAETAAARLHAFNAALDQSRYSLIGLGAQQAILFRPP
jgi:hypothetical protein